MKHKVLMLASVASMIDQFNMENISLMHEMGYEVHVACNLKKGNTCSAKRVRILQENLRSLQVVLHQWDCPRSIRKAALCWKAYRQLLELVSRYAFDWIHCHSPVGGALARVVAHQKKIRVIYTAHGFHFYQGAPWKNWIFYYPVEKLLSNWTDVLVTVNREDYAFAKRYLNAKKVLWIPGVGVDTAMFGGMSNANEKNSFCRKYRIPKNACVLLSVGELNKGKNHRMAIRALAALGRQDIYYLICGQGNQKNRLQRYADKMGVGKRVRMPGFQEEMDLVYRNADIFVFPSKREGMPVALMEAMAAGLACIVSDIRGNRELIEGTAAEYLNADENMRMSVPTGGVRFSLRMSEQLPYLLQLFIKETCLRKKCGDYNKRKIKGYDKAVIKKRMQKIYENMRITDV